MNAAPSMLSTCGRKRSMTAAIDRSLPWTVFTVIAFTAGSAAQRRERRRRRIDERPFGRQAESLRWSRTRRRLRRPAPRCDRAPRARPSPVPARDRSCRRPDVEREVVSRQRQRARAARGGRHHADARHQHVDIRFQIRPQRRDFALRRSDEQDSHQTSSSLSATAYGCAARLKTMVRPNSTSTDAAIIPR